MDASLCDLLNYKLPQGQVDHLSPFITCFDVSKSCFEGVEDNKQPLTNKLCFQE